uniref:Uncharacterized protein n=1 Tax=Magallana gigas TaxID=29159 RepID=K1QNY2_MAGGI
MELVLRLLCCYLCAASVTSFLWSPWAVIVFDDVSNDEPENFYTPFMNDRPRGTVDNRMRRPPPTFTQRRIPQRRILPNSQYPQRREIVSPSNTMKYISPYVSSPYCPTGQQYVYTPPAVVGDAVSSICPTNNPPRPLCRCQTGCRHKNFFIPYGTSIMVDKCANRCYCNNLKGEVECEFDSC